MSTTLYDILGVPKNASKKEIKDAWRNLAKENHPDTENGNKEKMSEINNAYAVLSAPEKRARYDATGEEKQKPFFNKFASFVDQVLSGIIERVENVDTTNIVKEFMTVIDDSFAQLSQHKISAKIKMSKIGKVQNRIKPSTDQTIVLILEAQISAIKSQISVIEEEMDFMKKCKDLIKSYKYDTDKEEAGARGLLEIFIQQNNRKNATTNR